MTTSTRPYPRPTRFMTEHITVPRPAWNEDDNAVLLFRVQRMKKDDVIEYGEWTIKKSWNSSEGNRWHVYSAHTKPRMFRQAAQAVCVVTGTENGQQETHNQEGT